MGMDLFGAGLSYNWSAWGFLIDKLHTWGVDVSEFSGMNDGARISKETCIAVANAIERHLHELDDEDQEFYGSHIENWRNCNGCSQY